MAVGLTFMAFLCFVHDSSDLVFVLETLLLFAVSAVLTLLRPATTHRYGRLILAHRCPAPATRLASTTLIICHIRLSAPSPIAHRFNGL